MKIEGSADIPAPRERVWAAFVHHGVSPCFHVADQPKVFDDAWYAGRDEQGVFAIESAMSFSMRSPFSTVACSGAPYHPVGAIVLMSRSTG